MNIFLTVYWFFIMKERIGRGFKSEMGDKFRKQDAKAEDEWRLPQLLFCHTSRVLSCVSPQHCASTTLLFLGAKKCGCYIIFPFCRTGCACGTGALHLCHHTETDLGSNPGRALNVLTLYSTPICWGWVRMATHEQLPLYQRGPAACCETSAANLA